MLLRVLKLARKHFNLLFHLVKLVLQINNLSGKLWNLRYLLPDNFQLSLPLLELKINHPYLLFFLPDLLFTIFEYILLNIALLIENTKLIIFIYKLYTHIVS